jgi:ribosomal protein S12 methylthiotransferase
MDIVQVVRELRKGPHPEPLYHLPDEAKTVGTDEHEALRVSVAGASAYLKIADGCRRPCAFCAIPLIKGTAVSRSANLIIDEARRLRDAGVRELILIAQDTTDYGHDLGIKDGLAVLLEQLTDSVPDMDWIRVMYAYPGYVTDRLIEVMATRKQVLPYRIRKRCIACAAPRTLTGYIARLARCAQPFRILPSAQRSLSGIPVKRKRNIRRWWIL